jgi:hypothetical protein
MIPVNVNVANYINKVELVSFVRDGLDIDLAIKNSFSIELKGSRYAELYISSVKVEAKCL